MKHYQELYKLGLSNRATNVILNSGIETVDQLYKAWQTGDYKHFRQAGAKVREEIDEWAKDYQRSTSATVKIVQIAPIIEYHSAGYDSDKVEPNEDATFYGLSSTGKPYYWGVTKSTYVETEPNEDNEYSKGHYEKEYDWKEVTA